MTSAQTKQPEERFATIGFTAPPQVKRELKARSEQTRIPQSRLVVMALEELFKRMDVEVLKQQ